MRRFEEMGSGGYFSGITEKYRPEQIMQMSNWDRVDDEHSCVAGMTYIHCFPSNGSTETIVNPLDPGDDMPCHYNSPNGYGGVIPAGRMY